MIEELQVGDAVLAWDPETSKTSVQHVTALIRPDPKPTFELKLRDADGEVESFNATADHPWYVEGAGWVETSALHPGQRVETGDDRGLDLLSVTPTGRTVQTYNLEVSGPHTYLVGKDGAVVHNACWSIVERVRRALGKDGASSKHIVEYRDGRVNSVTHQVTKDGQTIHQHQTHVGKFGAERQFPDEWVNYPNIGN